MNKKLEDSFDLPSMEEVEEAKETSDELDEMMLPTASGSGPSEEEFQMMEHTDEMNEIYQMALKAHQEILDFGYSADTKYSAAILNTSANYLDIAMRASKSKIENKLKQVKFKMEKESIAPKPGEKISEGEIVEEKSEYTSRNDIMDKIDKLLNRPKTD